MVSRIMLLTDVNSLLMYVAHRWDRTCILVGAADTFVGFGHGIRKVGSSATTDVAWH